MELPVSWNGTLKTSFVITVWLYRMMPCSEMSLDSSELAAAYEILAPFLDGGKVRDRTPSPGTAPGVLWHCIR